MDVAGWHRLVLVPRSAFVLLRFALLLFSVLS